MISVVIKGPSLAEVEQQISKAVKLADLIELRLDQFNELDFTAISSWRSQFKIPMIFTLRRKTERGLHSENDEKQLRDISRLAELEPEYLDLESDLPPQFVDDLKALHPRIRIICSYHNFEKTVHNLDDIYQEMQKIPAHYDKIAVYSANCLETLQLLCWAKNINEQAAGKRPLIAISMGPEGQFSRILGPIIGSPITYASLEDNLQTAPGQLTASTLISKYRLPVQGFNTSVYGLIGYPVKTSISDLTHNHLMATKGLLAVYLKIRVLPSELFDFLQLAKALPFKGLSVTMPLKELIVPFLDGIDPSARECGAVNTLSFENGKVIGSNTDGIGAMTALEALGSVRKKKIVILGAGGAAKGIANEALKRGANVTILNRNAEKAIFLAKQLQCAGGGLEQMARCAKEGYDMLINCTPSSLPTDQGHILSTAIVMDINTKPKETEFLLQAKEKGCKIVYGYQMFVEQALGQYDLWFKDALCIKENRKLLTQSALDYLEGH